MPPRRIADEPAYILHSHDWSESSLVLDAFTRHNGRVALVARGAKKPSSNFRPVLLPLQPLRLNYTPGEADIHSLKGAEWVGGHVMPTGDALLSGLYLNELLMRLTAREDPHAALFDAYARAVAVLAGAHGDALEPALRAFELVLLREIGLLPALDAETQTLAPLEADRGYSLVPEAGLRPAAGEDRGRLPGAQWLALQAALERPDAFTAVLAASAEGLAELKPQLRTLLNHHCGVGMLHTRRLMVDIQGL